MPKKNSWRNQCKQLMTCQRRGDTLDPREQKKLEEFLIRKQTEKGKKARRKAQKIQAQKLKAQKIQARKLKEERPKMHLSRPSHPLYSTNVSSGLGVTCTEDIIPEWSVDLKGFIRHG